MSLKEAGERKYYHGYADSDSDPAKRISAPETHVAAQEAVPAEDCRILDRDCPLHASISLRSNASQTHGNLPPGLGKKVILRFPSLSQQPELIFGAELVSASRFTQPFSWRTSPAELTPSQHSIDQYNPHGEGARPACRCRTHFDDSRDPQAG